MFSLDVAFVVVGAAGAADMFDGRRRDGCHQALNTLSNTMSKKGNPLIATADFDNFKLNSDRGRFQFSSMAALTTQFMRQIKTRRDS
jgi:hypothetical protein